MLQTVHNSEFSRTMDLFKEIDDLSDLFLLEKNTKVDGPEAGYEDLQTKYSSLHENYAKEVENSKKVEKCLIKCLKFYSKLSKKYEVQQQIIKNLEESIKEKVSSLEEAQRNEEKMKGLIDVYRTERTLYAGQTSAQLRKEKELLLDICCKLIGESVRSHSTSNLSSLLLRKFKKDLTDEKIILLKGKSIKLKDELEIDAFRDFKPDFGVLKEEFKSEDKCDITKVESKDPAEETKTDQLDLCQCEMTTQGSSYLENSQEDCEVEQEEPENIPSLPSLEELPLTIGLNCTENAEEQPSDVAGGKVIPECDPPQNGDKSTKPCSLEREKPVEMETNKGSQYSCKSLESHFDPVQRQNELPTQPTKGLASIFDISDSCENGGNSGPVNKKEENVFVETDFFSEVLFKSDDKSEDHSVANHMDRKNLDLADPEGDVSLLQYEFEVFQIFREMSSVRLLSPIRETNNSSIDTRNYKTMPKESRTNGEGNSESSRKRNLDAEENRSRNKKIKSEEQQAHCCLLDSIMTAMSIQNEEFKSKGLATKESRAESGEASEGSSCEFGSPRSRPYTRRNRRENSKSEENSGVVCRTPGTSKGREEGIEKTVTEEIRKFGENSGVVCRTPGTSKGREEGIEKTVTEEIRKFVSAPISCKEDADRNVKHCISALTNKSEDVIAKCIVAIVLENIDEPVEVFERPAPPLTKTQHRLVVLLSVFRTLAWDSEKISSRILSIISEKLFPDDFFWPDDCVEATARFYAALCRARNDPKTLWRFCLNAMTDMRQRCPLVAFTVLRTWPDVLHNASTLKNNVLAVTIVNIFLHMPKTEGLRNVNQKRKLVALKHLLINFYQFKMEETIEGHARKVLEGILRGEEEKEVGAEKSVVLLAKCRDHGWTLKNVVPVLKESLVNWFEGTLGDSVANTILSVIKQTCPALTQEKNAGTKIKDLALYLSQILTSRKKSHDSEVNIIETLLLLKQYPEVRKTICEWIPKNPINDRLRSDIINASAENILRELKLNRKKETKNLTVKKKQWKKGKGKKKKGKKKKKNEQKLKSESTGINCRS